MEIEVANSGRAAIRYYSERVLGEYAKGELVFQMRYFEISAMHSRSWISYGLMARLVTDFGLNIIMTNFILEAKMFHLPSVQG